MDGSRLLIGLDPDQRRAVTDPGQPLCILAGAGSGKTRVLTRRIAHRAHEGSADPRYVLALTFTRRAAAELGERLEHLGLRDRPTVGTFHAVAWAQLVTQARDQGRPAPSLLQHKWSLLARLPGMANVRTGELATEIEWARAREIPPESYPGEAHRQDRRTTLAHGQVADLYDRYEALKIQRGVIDFDDILSICADALERDPTFAAAQRWRFRHLFVDEFQDVNPLQHRLLMGWLGDRRDLCVVGDPDQAIYRWNGADAGFLVGFAARHPGASVVDLTRNYRSTPQVLHVAGAALGPGRPARLVAHRPSGETPRILTYPTDRDEAREVARAVRTLRSPGTRWDRQAVLVRTNAQMSGFREEFAAAGIPFRLRGDDLAAAVGDPGDPGGPGGPGSPSGAGSMRIDPDRDAVDIVTFHAAKGLEWPIVHLTGMESGLVPISMARTPEAEAEERRLLHVAVTRAEDVLRISWAQTRTIRGRDVARRPSPYLPALAEAIEFARREARPVDPASGLTRARRALAAGTDEPDRSLLEALRSWRDRTARASDVPPAVVLSDRVLSDIARLHPRDTEALTEVRGMGALTVDAHGPAVVAVVADHDARRAASRP